MITEETSTGYAARRCDLCAGLTKVLRQTAIEWNLRNKPIGKPDPRRGR